MKDKKVMGRPTVPPHLRAFKSLRIAAYQVDELKKLGYSNEEQPKLIRDLVDNFIKANGGSTYERK